jgi:hypothetical protein
MVGLVTPGKVSHFKKKSLATLDPSPVNVGFVLVLVALGEIFLRVPPFPLSVLFHHRSVSISSTNDAI